MIGLDGVQIAEKRHKHINKKLVKRKVRKWVVEHLRIVYRPLAVNHKRVFEQMDRAEMREYQSQSLRLDEIEEKMTASRKARRRLCRFFPGD